MTRKKKKRPFIYYDYVRPDGFRHISRSFRGGEHWRALDPKSHILLAETVIPDNNRLFSPAVMRDWRRIAMSQFVKKALAGMKGSKGKPRKAEDKLWEHFPALGEFMTLAELPDKSKRTPSTLTLSSDAYACKGALKEHDEGLMLWASAGSFWDVLEALEEQLTGDAPDWRVDKWAKGKPGKK